MEKEENKITLLTRECQKCIDELLEQGYTEEQILEEMKTIIEKIKQGYKEDNYKS